MVAVSSLANRLLARSGFSIDVLKSLSWFDDKCLLKRIFSSAVCRRIRRSWCRKRHGLSKAACGLWTRDGSTLRAVFFASFHFLIHM